MDAASRFALAVLLLLVGKWGAEVGLARLNRREVKSQAGAVPAAFAAVIDSPTYAKTVAYTLAKSRLQIFELGYHAVWLVVVLFSGLLPWVYAWFGQHLGTSAWAMAGFLFATGIALSIPSLPIDWYAQFRLEQEFGFNTSTQRIWWIDRLKGLLLGFALGYPLLTLVLKLVEWTGPLWWLWAWGAVLGFQLLMSVLAPVIILPLFNKFTPLPEGSLRNRLLQLAERAAFRARSIQVMDGSKRSRHSNAFFIGFGRFRKIVLFDTLVEQLAEEELTAVLAHEIGHYKKMHLPKMLAASALGSLVGFYLVAMLAQQDWFYRAFGFAPGSLVPALLLFTLLSGLATFWLSPLLHAWSRRYEYEADAFAAEMMAETESLVGALRKLSTKNLSNLTPHPIYSAFYYSHPTLLEREKALAALVKP